MNNALFQFAKPANEPVKEYRPGSPERLTLEAELKKQTQNIQNKIKQYNNTCY